VSNLRKENTEPSDPLSESGQISDGDDSLFGTELLDGSRLIVDYVAYTVTVSDEVI
jgi:hypothetical protein